MTHNITAINEVKLSFHPAIKPTDLDQIKTSKDVYEIFLSNWSKDTISLVMEIKVLFVNRANRVVHIYTNASGGPVESAVGVKLIYLTGIRLVAEGFIIAINRPSGNTEPAKTDQYFLEKLKEGCRFVDLKVLDYLLITPDSYYSMADNGML